MLTPEQYLERERAAQDVRSEYYNGRMYARSGGRIRMPLLLATWPENSASRLRKVRA